MKVDSFNKYIILRVEDDIVNDNVEEFGKKLLSISEKHNVDIVIDFESVEYLCSLALKYIVTVSEKLSVGGNELIIMNPTERVKRLFSFIRLNTIIKILDGEDEFVEYLNLEKGHYMEEEDGRKN